MHGDCSIFILGYMPGNSAPAQDFGKPRHQHSQDRNRLSIPQAADEHCHVSFDRIIAALTKTPDVAQVFCSRGICMR